MATEIVVTSEFESWYEILPVTSRTAIIRVVDLVQEQGATLGFPYSSAIAGSSFALCELRVQVQVQAILLLAATKLARVIAGTNLGLPLLNGCMPCT